MSVRTLGCFTVWAMIPIAAVIQGFAVQYLWLWFVVPFGAVPLTFWWALGLGSLARVLTRHGNGPTARPGESDRSFALRAISTAVFGPLLSLVLGWLYTWGM